MTKPVLIHFFFLHKVFLSDFLVEKYTLKSSIKEIMTLIFVLQDDTTTQHVNFIYDEK